MRILLIEFSWHAQEIIKNKEYFKKDVIVSLNAEASYILKINQIPYFESYQFCNHKELWTRYKEITDRTIKITKFLDEALWNTDKRFKDLNWKFFNDYHYPLKISFDQLFYYSELISRLIEKFNPSEIIVAETKKILIEDDCFLINRRISVIKYLLKTLKGDDSKIKISFILQNKNEKSKFLFFANFKNLIKSELKNIYHKINFLIGYYFSKPKYLSIECFEILRYKKLYPNQSRFFLNYHHNNYSRKKNIKDPNFFKNFTDYLRNETHFFDLIQHKNISFKLIFNEILFKLTQQLDFFLKEHDKAKDIINRIKPRCVIFQTMSPFNSATVVFRKNCIDFKIPFVTWAHGGYGLTYSLSPYDVTDFRFCKNHISYGTHLKNLVLDNKCVLKQLEIQENQKIFPVGSCRLDYDNRKKNSKRILQENNRKKTILFLIGWSCDRNHFHFGYKREKLETLLWELNYDILCLLKKYQNKYNIIFKDYPNGSQNLWKSALKDINANEILFVSDEYSVNDLLKISDLNIIPWGSTTFFEALYFDADIFFIEEDIFKKPFEEKLKNEIFYFNNNNEFLLALEKYLKIGNFYTCNKKNSQNFFLKFDSLNKRDQLLKEALSKITNKN
jgi:hypothetical protein